MLYLLERRKKMANFEQINFKNGEAPYLSKQNLNEIQTRMNKALNDTEKELTCLLLLQPSNKNTYHQQSQYQFLYTILFH